MAFIRESGGTPTFEPRVGGTPKIAVERKMEQGFHSGGYDDILRREENDDTLPANDQNATSISQLINAVLSSINAKDDMILKQNIYMQEKLEHRKLEE